MLFSNGNVFILYKLLQCLDPFFSLFFSSFVFEFYVSLIRIRNACVYISMDIKWIIMKVDHTQSILQYAIKHLWLSLRPCKKIQIYLYKTKSICRLQIARFYCYKFASSFYAFPSLSLFLFFMINSRLNPTIGIVTNVFVSNAIDIEGFFL